MKVAGLFAGIGGFECGLSRAGHSAEMLCEIDELAGTVLSERFPAVNLRTDVRDVRRLPSDVEILTAGFPCQDLSQAGKTAGIRGQQSGLVAEVFRIVKRSRPRWVILENVAFMLKLKRGAAMKLITKSFEELGYDWAYRVVDSRSFGVPQRRKRVFLVAALDADPSLVLLADDAGDGERSLRKRTACGFYWTEGNTGLGWAIDSIPPLKGGSSFGIPSPPAIWIPERGFFTPDIRDAERLQGFDAEWTRPAEIAASANSRWKLVGNAITVGAATWLGKCLERPGKKICGKLQPLESLNFWPSAACSRNGIRNAVEISQFPRTTEWPSLRGFLRYSARPLSLKAAKGFRDRLFASGLNYSSEFGRDLDRYVKSNGASKSELVPSAS